ncbi:MAG: hypothetical protein KDL10_02430 [Kiritimatiellae bacterium]|nr:hypothetical protein [Kiritimatiellia bacterium]
MIFLASTVFILLLYVLPGFWVLDRVAHSWLPSGIPDGIKFWFLAVAVYAVCLLTVRIGRFAYDDFQVGREKYPLKSFLDPRGCRWLTGMGLILIGAQAAYMTSRWAMPYSFVPLYAGLLLGFFDLRRRPLPSIDYPELPESSVEETGAPPLADVAGHSVTLQWEYLEHGQGDSWVRFDKTYVLSSQATRGPVVLPPGDPQAYTRLVKEGLDDGIREIAADLRSESRERKYTPLQELENVVRMVQSVPYRPDRTLAGGADQPSDPAQTLSAGAGDCEDHAILAAAILWLLGHPVGLFLLRMDDESHMALAYRTDAFEGSYCSRATDGRVYSFIETTPADGELGDGPQDLLGNIRRVTVLPL